MDENNDLISLAEAATTFKDITGRSRNQKYLADSIHAHPHLAAYAFDPDRGRARFIGVRRDRFIYFVKTRLLLYGPRNIFMDSQEK